ncbi:DUF3426 domain-containing protein [Pseudoduganella sp. FT25W]|uniref:DUF3426 domain-containing protein n=1 Tax=Duganella alba TaxID=2666081 RepID=A0A6L5QNF8_9BURK|nr:DUF3426 domain-containing protein [Duganella alba]MRX11384.1 DUF3426 domain-containing protein [Duganella alba]MRX19511.1 DUF3426 domain-containing protein [Duganella alba]
MALATKCPHCNTVFRVAHDQLKLRGGIVRCGSCNEVFDGNAALLEPLTPPPVVLPEPTPLDQKMAALDTRAAEVLAVEEAEPVLELGEPEAPEPAPEPPPPVLEMDDEAADVPAPEPFPLPAEPAALPADTDALFDLDLDMESEPDLEASIDPELAPQPALEELNVEHLSDDELEAALEAELAVMEQSLADAPHEADDSAPSDGRREPTWDDPEPDEPQAGAGPALERAFAAADDAIFSADAEPDTPPAPEARPLRDDELDEADEEALIQLSSAGLAQAEAVRAPVLLHTPSAEAPEPPAAPEEEHDESPEEPGFVKRDRQRQKYGKAATIAMSLGSVLLVAALLGQAVTTFRNTLAAAMPPLKPALTAACNALGCKIELPTQIDDLMIEQGELQTLSDTAFSFTTLLRNQSATAQSWPSIELTLDDANDKRILRRVFTPRDYLSADIALDKGFAPHTEQAVKLYFELHDLKASGYHIAVFYP